MRLLEKILLAMPPSIAIPLMTAPVALAVEGDIAGVNTVQPSEFANKLRELAVNVGTPVGAAVLVGCLIIVALKFMTSGGNDRKRQEALEGLTSVAIGGAILGATMFLAGVILGIGDSLK